MSPAAPSAPRCTWPPATNPEPMPVPIFTNSRKGSFLQWAQCSPTAMMLTSLSTSAGTPNRAASRSPTGCRFHPGMIGGDTGLPVANSTGPGRPTPTPRRSPMSRPARRRRSVEGPLQPREDDVGALGDGDVLGVLGQHPAGQVGDRDPGVGGSDVAGQHHPDVAVEGQHRRGSPSRGGAVAARHEQAVGEQRVDPLGDGGARTGRSRWPGHPGWWRARCGPARGSFPRCLWARSWEAPCPSLHSR